MSLVANFFLDSVGFLFLAVDFKKICRDLKEKEKSYGDRVVSLPAKGINDN